MNIVNKKLVLNKGYSNSKVIIERAYSCFLEYAEKFLERSEKWQEKWDAK
jgi:hypothetical protein